MPPFQASEFRLEQSGVQTVALKNHRNLVVEAECTESVDLLNIFGSYEDLYPSNPCSPTTSLSVDHSSLAHIHTQSTKTLLVTDSDVTHLISIKLSNLKISNSRIGSIQQISCKWQRLSHGFSMNNVTAEIIRKVVITAPVQINNIVVHKVSKIGLNAWF